MEGPPAIYGKTDTCNEVGFRPCQEQNCLSLFGDFAQALQGISLL